MCSPPITVQDIDSRQPHRSRVIVPALTIDMRGRNGWWAAMHPLRPLDASVLLDRAVDALDDGGRVDAHARSSVEQHVSPPARGTREAVDARLPQAGGGESEALEPPCLDRREVEAVVEVAVDAQFDPFRSDAVTLA